MFNKIKSFNIRGSRQPGRPFNTTKHPWRSTAIGRGFFIPGRTSFGGQMSQKLKAEGFNYTLTAVHGGMIAIRVA
jgi:hypothetical protein